ncbi:uncharacterized protein LOC143576690 [Bidens hawaiensis]|uniref:uncharacterized protein LOC143576690 n=1 Tax=Bidens hawaiensis TaxID=980011 RepID=UPI00404B3144
MANSCLNLPQHSIPHSSSSSSLQTLASAITSPSANRRSLTHLALAYRFRHRSAIFGTKLSISKSETSKTRIRKPVNGAVTAGLDAQFSDEEFTKKIKELALGFQVSDEADNKENYDELELEWQGDMIPASIERKANSVDLPFSLRIIKKKKQWREGIREAGESAYCSVKKAFSSMVFIIRELQSYTLHMREFLYYQDLQDILVRVQKEMNASFVWLFQQVFSQTPTLMVYVMILLANYSVHSMACNNFAIAAAPPSTMESVTQHHTYIQTKFDSFSTGGKTTSIGGNNGGGGNIRPVASGTDGDGRFDGSVASSSGIGNPGRTSEESVSGQASEDEELKSWNSIVDEADRMQIVTRDDGLDHETMRNFVSPVTVKIEEEDAADYFRTKLLYQTGLSQEPDNPLLLANYAQFLYLVARDYDRAEDYFKKASKVEPKDAEALNKYASFLWQIRKDLWAAEETYLEAISTDPSNSFYAANYAHFLWSTGGEDTCFPLDSPDDV